MKKLLYLLFVLTVLSACGSDDPNPNPPTPPITEWDGDWNNPSDPKYQGNYNPIKGEWIVVKKNGATFEDFLVYQFDTFYHLLTATKKPAENTDPTFKFVDRYIINGTAYKIKNTIYKYKLASDLKTLEITDGTTTLVLQPYESGAWKWKGDWNNPKDSNYKPEYEGKYNPIVGTWKLTHVGDVPVEPVLRRFNDDFTVENPSDRTTKRRYWINDIGVKEDKYLTVQSYTYSYRIEGNMLYYRIMLPAPPSLELIYVRYSK